MSEDNSRQAFILFDQAVEVMSWDYLRMFDSEIQAKNGKSPNFNILMDRLHSHHSARLGSIDVDRLKWFHAVRNTLHHSPDALSVDRVHLDEFSELAQRMYRNLFYGEDLSPDEARDFAAFERDWKRLVSAIDGYTAAAAPRSSHGFTSEQVLNAWFGEEYRILKTFRDRVLRREFVHRPDELSEHCNRIHRLLERLGTSPAGGHAGYE